ncbi:unnamed protein product [Polarella glacialis]|uniref:Uncharacterized protein n=1 Tax=Polarella glacialis TaxID=89957 RepID=A0A813K8L6_POLGL|nr:unnamed protein product [Polarella glacialis]CAE8697101.1 unnamed protein product [Polarella glacialis]
MVSQATMAEDKFMWVFVSFLYMTLFAYGVLLIRNCCVKPEERKKLCDAFTRASSWGAITMKRGDHNNNNIQSKESSPASDLNSAVCKLAEVRRLATFRFSISAVSPFLALTVAHRLVLNDWTYDPKLGETSMLDGHTMTAALVVGVAALCMIWKRQPISALRTCFNIGVSARMVWKLFHYTNAYQLVFDRTDVMSIRFGLSFVAGSPGVSAVLNCIYSALSCYVFAELRQTTPDLSEHFGQDCLRDFAIQEAIFCVVVSILGLATDMRLVSEASSTIQVKASHAEHQSLSMLLNTMCDVVVELDSLFGLVDKGERLSAFLLQGPGRSLRKTCFLDFMYQAADRESFSQHLQQPRHGLLRDMAIPIHARMRDSSGFALHVELIHAQYERLDGSVHYIVGIRELAEGSQGCPAVSEGPEPEMLGSGLRRPAPRVIGALESRDLQRGTPGLQEKNDFSPVALPGRLPRAPCSSETKLLLPNFRETPVQTRLMSILSLMSSWNVQVSAKTCRCCTFHAVAKEVVFATNLLKHKACLNMAEICHDWQCPSCGILDIDAETAGFQEETGICATCPPPSALSLR